MAKVALILTENFADWEYALIAGTGGPYYGLEVEFFAPQAGQISSMGGLSVMVSRNTAEISAWQPEVVVVVGGLIWTTDEAPKIAELIITHHHGGDVIAGICGGTLALTRSGLLNDIEHTSNDKGFLVDNAEGYAGSEFYCQSPLAVSYNRVITALGTAPVSFTATMFKSVGVDAETLLQFREMMAAEHI